MSCKFTIIRLLILLPIVLFILSACANDEGPQPTATPDNNSSSDNGNKFSSIDDIGSLQRILKENEEDTFAGLWVEHEPEYRLIVAFTDDGEETISKYVKNESSLADILELRKHEATLKQLEKASNDAFYLFKEIDIPFSSRRNIPENRVEFFVTDTSEVFSALDNTGDKLPDLVTIIEVAQLDQPNTT